MWLSFRAAATAALAGFAVITSAVLLGWAASSTGASAAAAVRVGIQAWLLAQHGRLHLPLGDLGLVPLGLTALLAVLLYRAGASLARSLGVEDPSTAVKALVALAGPYAVLVVLGTGLADTSTLRVDPLTTLLGAAVLAVFAGGAGLLAGSPLGSRLRHRLPAATRLTGRAALVGVATLLAAGAVLTAVALLAHRARADELSHALAPGLLDGVALTLLGVLYAPNAAVWGTGYVLGPGFGIGTGTVVSPFSVALGPVPAFPLLAALPDGPPPPTAGPLVLAVPVLTGVLVGLLVGRRHPGGWRSAAWSAALAGVLAGLALAGLAWLAGGPLGAGRLAALGPSPWQVGLAAGVGLGLPAAATAAVVSLASGRRGVPR